MCVRVYVYIRTQFDLNEMKKKKVHVAQYISCTCAAAAAAVRSNLMYVLLHVQLLDEEKRVQSTIFMPLYLLNFIKLYHISLSCTLN